ncbi:pilus assembly protein TadE [Caulobacter sp. Root1455]|jgi:Flp pilus assembly protein TadG|uniref:TadE/TadG family type IV pilus assembly protein n=1 Tax=unclassified Caulobacter TaxID=2648921 RepID=UPI0006FFF343|nr:MULTISPECIES: TadE/TadG family type IV pilus assembly protein [unclassified Caulobacter]KQY35563.1 pilus assembly protein TadE [Caulobacter sp. Root487D2Y]KQZ06472.1 pilus assembly protein TadE [Caulobacter sp. Root1455]
MADRARHHRQLLARLGLLRRFARADDGAAAIEFAFVAIPFLILVFAIIELGLTFLVSMSLENALSNVDRTIRTGTLQTSGGNAASFHQDVCNEMSWLGASCASALTLDVRVLPSFAQTKDLPKPLPGATSFDPGGPNAIVLVRGYYKWPLITPLLEDAVAGSSGDREVTFAAVFTNEPYPP